MNDGLSTASKIAAETFNEPPVSLHYTLSTHFMEGVSFSATVKKQQQKNS